MSPDDARHGTLNGYNTHNRHGEKACRPCLDARAADRTDKKRPGPEARAKSKWTNYTLDGYDEQDGLEGGQWMRDTWGVVRWVQIQQPQPKPQRTGPRALCLDCSQPVDRRALRCKKHSQIEAARVKREWARKARSKVA